MTFRTRIRAAREEVWLGPSAVLSVMRLEATILAWRFAYGLALAVPLTVRHESASGRKRHPVADPELGLRCIALAGTGVLLGSLIAEARRSHDDRRV